MLDVFTTLEAMALLLIPAVAIITKIVKGLIPTIKDNKTLGVVVLISGIAIIGIHASNGTLNVETVDSIILQISANSVGAVGIYNFYKGLFVRK